MAGDDYDGIVCAFFGSLRWHFTKHSVGVVVGRRALANQSFFLAAM